MAALAFAGALLAGVDGVLDCTGAPGAGRLAIDEGHSGWEPTDLRLGEETYGQETGYNFRALADWLAAGYGPIRRLYDPIDAATLSEVDVLVLKTPTEHYAEEEWRAIEAFVRAGGGLLLIGDHTNVFGTSEVLNRFATRLGFRFVYDCVFDQRQTFEQVWRREASQEHHPVLRRVPQVRLEVGCSIDVDDPRVRPVMIGRGLKTLPIDYTADNYYPAVVDASDMGMGQFPELVVRSLGRGRVAALSDSTFLSTFSVCLPGRRELLEGIVDWLGRREAGEPLRRALQAAGLLLLGCALALARRGGPGAGTLLLLWGAAGAVLPLQAARRLAYAPAPPLRGSPEVHEVVFYSGSDTAFWPVEQLVREYDRSYHTFFQWVLRTGAFPRLEDDLGSALASGAPVVLLDPPAALAGDLEELERFLAGGGVLVAAQSAPNPAVAALADLAGLSLAEEDALFASERLFTAFGPVELGGRAGGLQEIRGGDPLLVAEDVRGSAERAVAVTAPVGAGRLVLATCGSLFTDEAYGRRYDVLPDENRRRLYQFQYALIRACTAGGGSGDGQP